MEARLSVIGSTLYEVQEQAHKELQAFFGEVGYRVTGSEAEPEVVVESFSEGRRILSWKAHYTAEATL